MNPTKNSSPSLRFPEFDDDWKLARLGDLFEERIEFTEEALPLQSLTIEAGIVPKTERYERSFLVQSEDDAYKVMHKDDFAFNPMNLRFGALARYKNSERILVSKYYNIFYCNENADPVFAENYLTSYNVIQFYNKMASGSLDEKKRVHYSDFVNFTLRYPQFPEQQKIAAFLSAVEEKIAQIARKKELLHKYKRDVMQQIFDQQIRFKEQNGSHFPDWEDVRLRDVASSLDHKRVPLNKTQREKMKGDIPYWGANNIVDFVNDYIFDEDLVLLAEDGGYFDEFQTRPIANFSSGKCWVNNHAHVLRANKKILSKFLYFSLVHKNILGFVNAGTRSKLNKSDMLLIKIPLPSKPEQSKIIELLTSLEKKTEIVDLQLGSTTIFKKALLQQMFV